MYLENSKTIIVKIGSSLIIDDKKIIQLSTFNKKLISNLKIKLLKNVS